MIGIYKITNKVNGKIYVGQSNNIDRRFSEHKTKGLNGKILIDKVIKEYGVDSFLFEVIEECSIEELNNKETYWIKFYNSKKEGYNCSDGGDQQSIGENNGRSKLTEEDVILIRKAYLNHERQKNVYEVFKNKISFGSFQAIWQGRTWSHIMPEVFTKENKDYFVRKNCLGEKSSKSRFSDEEVIKIRQRYVSEPANIIYLDYNDRVKYQTFQAILWGRCYTHLPIYKKKIKKWINV